LEDTVVQSRKSKIGVAILAGSIAILCNTLALKSADLIPLATAKGGLLRLISLSLGPFLQATGLSSIWIAVGGPTVGSPIFQTGFHVVVGLLMALFYAVAIEPNFSARPITKGLMYALVVWIINAMVVLPATGEGIAGIYHLSAFGIVWFAVAHTMFFVFLALLYAYFNQCLLNYSKQSA
jgi:hypothetical protein